MISSTLQPFLVAMDYEHNGTVTYLARQTELTHLVVDDSSNLWVCATLFLKLFLMLSTSSSLLSSSSSSSSSLWLSKLLLSLLSLSPFCRWHRWHCSFRCCWSTFLPVMVITSSTSYFINMLRGSKLIHVGHPVMASHLFLAEHLLMALWRTKTFFSLFLLEM